MFSGNGRKIEKLFYYLIACISTSAFRTTVLTSSVLLCVVVLTAGFLKVASYFNQAPFDGVFQTLFPLLEIEKGKYPGRDFFYFHGNGIPYLIYPVFKIFCLIGYQTLYASLLATFIVNLVALYVPVYLLVNRWYGHAVGIGAVLVISVFMKTFFVFGYYYDPWFIGAPMGMRILPHMMVAISIERFVSYIRLNDATLKGIYARLAACSLIASLGALIAAEQGFYALAGGAVAILFCTKRLWSKWTPIYLVIIFLFLFVLFYILIQLFCFGNFATLQAIKTIAEEQVWVFGVAPNAYFSNWRGLFEFRIATAIPSQLATIIAAIVLAGFLTANRFLKISVSAQCCAALLTLFFGALFSWASNIGYTGQHQGSLFFRFVFFAVLVVVIEISRRLGNVFHE